MTNALINICNTLTYFPLLAVIFTLPIVVLPVLHYKKINIMRIGLNYVFLLYIMCLISLVFFPLPDMNQIARMDHYYAQIIPFHFIADIVNDTPFILNQPSTYLPAVFDFAIWQVLLNVIMTIPFGMYLRYYFECNTKKIVVFTFLLSLFIELGQLTGLFFLYPGSYRLCDIDDLIANTLGGYLGCQIIPLLYKVLPSIHAFDHNVLNHDVHGTKTFITRRYI